MSVTARGPVKMRTRTYPTSRGWEDHARRELSRKVSECSLDRESIINFINSNPTSVPKDIRHLGADVIATIIVANYGGK